MVKIVKSNFLRDSVIKSVLNEYEIKSQEMSKDELTYGTEVIDPAYDPFQLDKLRDISGLHDICITVKCEDAIFTGKKIISKEGEEIPEGLDDFLNDFNFDEEIESFLEDLEAFGFAGLELLREKGELKSVNHVSSLYLRMCRDKKRVVQKIGHKENYFKLYDPDNIKQLNRETGLWDDNITDENRANDLIWFNLKSNESLVYGRPKYLSELDAILTDNAIIEYQQGHFKAHGIPNYIITVTGNVEEKEDYTFDDFEEDLEHEFREVSNEPGTALVFTIPSEENNVSVNVTKIADEKKEGSFLELSGSVADRIRRIHRVPRERLGDSESTGIASNRTETFARQEILETTMDDLKNTRLVMGRLSDLAGEDGVKLELNYGNSVYGKIISSNPEINTGENVVINFIVNGVSYERTTDANGRAILPIRLDPGSYMLEGIVKRGAAGENPRLEQTRLLIVH